MSTVHDHQECPHKELAYCKTCRVAYCKACGQEWREPPVINIPSVWSSTQPPQQWTKEAPRWPEGWVPMGQGLTNGS